MLLHSQIELDRQRQERGKKKKKHRIPLHRIHMGPTGRIFTRFVFWIPVLRRYQTQELLKLGG